MSGRTQFAWSVLLCVGVFGAQPACALELPAAMQAKATAVAEVEQLVRDWAASWDRSDVGRYLSYYANDFRPGDGLNHEQWEEQRRERLSGGGPRYVIVRDLKVDASGEQAIARFTQHYLDMRRIGTATKRMVVVKQRGMWKIREERIEAEHETLR